MPSERPRPVALDESEPTTKAFGIARRLRESRDPAERAVGEFVIHGLMSALDAPVAVRQRLVPRYLPQLAHGLAHLGYAFRHGEVSEQLKAPMLLARFMLVFDPRSMSAELRPHFRYLAKAALRDRSFMIDLARGRERLPEPDEIDDAIDRGLEKAL